MPQSRSIRNPTSRVYPSPGSACPCRACIRWAGAVFMTLLGLLVTLSWASDDEYARATLRGLGGVQVLVAEIRADLEHAGLTRQQLQTDIEGRLRRAGMRVLAPEERLLVPRAPYLYVSVVASLVPDAVQELIVYGITMEVRQNVVLDTTSALVYDATTWSTPLYVGSVGRVNMSQIRETVSEQVDPFINAYLSVNARPTGSLLPTSTAPPRAPQPARRTR